MPHPVSLPLAALHFLLPSLRFWAAVTTLPISVNTPPYPAVLVMFLSLPVFDQAPAERDGAMNHDGTWPVGLCVLFPLAFSLIQGFLSYLVVVLRLPLSYSRVSYHYNGRLCIP